MKFNIKKGPSIHFRSGIYVPLNKLDMDDQTFCHGAIRKIKPLILVENSYFTDVYMWFGIQAFLFRPWLNMQSGLAECRI